MGTVNMKDVGPAEKNREQFRVAVGVRSEQPLKTGEVSEGALLTVERLDVGDDQPSALQHRLARRPLAPHAFIHQLRKRLILESYALDSLGVARESIFLRAGKRASRNCSWYSCALP